MNIVVLVKQVPDTWAERKLNDSDKTLDRASVDVVMNEIDEYAVEEALRIKEAQGGEVTILTMGPERAVETIRKALSMGADKAVHLTDDALKGSDAVQTSYALAKVLETLEYDLVIAGSEATDSRMAIMGALLSERLGQPQLTGARKVTAEAGSVTIERQTDDGYAVVTASTPAILSVVEKINEPRYPSFKGIMVPRASRSRRCPSGTPVSRPGRSALPPRRARSWSSPPSHRGKRVRSSRTRVTAAPRSPSSSPRRSSSRRQGQHG